MTTRPTGIHAREVNLYRRYFDLVAAGTKIIEVRVRVPAFATSQPATISASYAAATTPSPG